MNSFERFLLRKQDIETSQRIALGGTLSYLRGDIHKGSKDELFDQASLALNLVNELLLVCMIDNFNSFLSDTVSEILKKDPRPVFGKKLDIKTIFEYDDIENLRQATLEKHISDLGYQSITDLADFFERFLGITRLSSRITQLRLARLIQMRNLIVHNRSIVNRIFLQRSGSKIDKINDRVKIRAIKWHGVYLAGLTKDIFTETSTKFFPEAAEHA